MQAENHWDPHTRQIIAKRLDTQSFVPYQFFTEHEGATLFQLCAALLDDRRYEIIAFVVHHFDSTLHASLGQSQRKIDIPKQSALIRKGLARLDQSCNQSYGKLFTELEETERKQAIKNAFLDSIILDSGETMFPIKEFMKHVLVDAVAAYYSHPYIWSEIGYAGPAYPRGYVRSELGLTDPWEAQSNG